MRKLLLILSASVALAACAPKPVTTLVCIDRYEEGKYFVLGEDTCRETSNVVLTDRDDDTDRTVPNDERPEQTPDDPTDPSPEPEPDNPTPDVDKPKKTKGNNGWGNGDQSAPGKSGGKNNAENSDRSQRNHGQGRPN